MLAPDIQRPPMSSVPRDHTQQGFVPFADEIAAKPELDDKDRHSVLSSLTVSLVPTYKRCSPNFEFSGAASNPPRVLTKPSEPAVLGGNDNINDDLIVTVSDVFISSLGVRYVVRDVLGQGTFGQVFKCSSAETAEMVAIKVIKNQAAYYHQARVEIGVLQFLNTKGDPRDRCHIVRLKDFFLHKNHLCLVFELLNLNLFELMRHNKFRGLSLALVRVFMSQMLVALVVLHKSSIIHCDIKPENILLTTATSGEVKLIDFGSACFANRTVYSYIQSRFYRSPEVVLGYHYNVAVDMWSLGCVAAELFLGLPLLPAACELDLLGRIVETLGPLPPSLVLQGKHSHKFFEPVVGQSGAMAGAPFRLRTSEEFTEATGQKAPTGKHYFQHKTLADIIKAYPIRQGLSKDELLRERGLREAFTDFLLGLLDVDPRTRWTPRQAQEHPFITGAPFTGPFQPAPDPIAMGGAAAASGGAGTPMSIPEPRARAAQPVTGGALMDQMAAALLASSPQVHAHAHAAAMAAVQMQMSLKQGGGVYGGRGGPVDGMMGTSYTAAHSLQRIMSTAARAGDDSAAAAAQQQQWGGSGSTSMAQSLPAPLFSPPSRSFRGIHMAQQGLAASEMPPPSFDPGQHSTHRIMPLMHLPATGSSAGQVGLSTETFQPSSVAMRPSSTENFQPSSVASYLSAVAAAARTTSAAAAEEAVSAHHQGQRAGGLGGDLGPAQAAPAPLQLFVGGGSADGSAGGTTPRRENSASQLREDTPNPADWDPLWSDDLLKEDEPTPDTAELMSPGGAFLVSNAEGTPLPRSHQAPHNLPPDLVLAAQHLTQLQQLNPTEPAAHFERKIDSSGHLKRSAETLTASESLAGTSEGAQEQTNMLWSPPRPGMLMSVLGLPEPPTTGDTNRTANAQERQVQQILHGFTVPSKEKI